jgi:hypothetical protein
MPLSNYRRTVSVFAVAFRMIGTSPQLRGFRVSGGAAHQCSEQQPYAGK